MAARPDQHDALTASAGGATDELLRRLGDEVRERRKAAGLTVQRLADAAGLSRRLVTQVELGQANPSLATIDRIARALGTDFATLAGGGPSEDGGAGPARGARVWTSPAGSAATLHAATRMTPPAELWEWTLGPRDVYLAEPDPAGSEELFLVLSGTLTIAVDGAEPRTLPAGAAFRLASDRPYSYQNRAHVPVRFVRVVQIATPRDPGGPADG